jgi:hypothetical protein
MKTGKAKRESGYERTPHYCRSSVRHRQLEVCIIIAQEDVPRDQLYLDHFSRDFCSLYLSNLSP